MSSDPAAVGDRGRVSAELVEHLCSVRGEPALTTRELSEILSSPAEVVEQDLEQLRCDNKVERFAITKNRHLWWTGTN